jgi:hypothetical protein
MKEKNYKKLFQNIGPLSIVIWKQSLSFSGTIYTHVLTTSEYEPRYYSTQLIVVAFNISKDF